MVMAWTGVHCAFAVETFFKIDEFVFTTQSNFCAHFMLCQNDVLDRIFNP